MHAGRAVRYVLLAVCFVWVLIIFIVLGGCVPKSASNKSIVEEELIELRKEVKFLRSYGSYADAKRGLRTDDSLPIIYVITPTYARVVQKAELTRLHNTLLSVPRVHWIVVEDAPKKSDLVRRFVKQAGLPNVTHLHAATHSVDKLSPSDPNWLKPRGVLQRNEGLRWVRQHGEKLLSKYSGVPGVVYFADDDNTYDLRLFEEMRYTRKASVWPVGIVGYLRYETPILKNGKVVSWFSFWKVSERRFATDMAGFAVSLSVLLSHPEASFSLTAGRGQQESHFLKGLGLALDDLEPKANLCSQVLVWHTRTETPTLKNEPKMRNLHGHGTDLNIEV